VEPGSPHEIEFTHRRLKTGLGLQGFQDAQAGVEQLKKTVVRRAQISRALFVIAGALVIAWGTQRAGIELPQALCFFFGTLPVLWVGGWLAGAMFQARRTVRQATGRMGSTAWQREAQAATVQEQVKLTVSDEALVVKRDGVESRHDWPAVHLNRLGPDQATLHFGAQSGGFMLEEALVVPSSVFPNPEAFDEFCLAIQRRLWAAQRLAITNRRA
jgi:hypothetical protein